MQSKCLFSYQNTFVFIMYKGAKYVSIPQNYLMSTEYIVYLVYQNYHMCVAHDLNGRKMRRNDQLVTRAFVWDPRS